MATWLKTEPKYATHGGRLVLFLSQKAALGHAGRVLLCLAVPVVDCPLVLSVAAGVKWTSAL